MTRRIYYLLMVMLFATYGVSAQNPTMRIATVEDASPGWVSVGVYASDIQGLTGFNLVLDYEPALLEASEEILNKFAPGFIWSVGVDNIEGEIEIFFMDLNGSDFDPPADEEDPGTLLFDMQFQYTGHFDAPIAFDIDHNLFIIEIEGSTLDNLDDFTFIDGAVLPSEDIAGTISMDTVDDAIPGQLVQMPIYLEGENEGFANIAGLNLKIGFHPAQLVYEGVEENPDVDIEFTQNVDDGEILLNWASANEIDFSEKTRIAYLNFIYTAVGEAEVVFLPGTQVLSFDALPIAQENGLIIPSEDIDGVLEIEHIAQYQAGEVEVPVWIRDLGDDFPAVGAITLRLGFDDDKMQYVSYSSDYSDSWDISAGDASPVEFQLTILDEDGITLEDDTPLLTLYFNFTEAGMSPLEFLDGSLLYAPVGAPVPINFVSGSVTVSVSGALFDALVDARENTHLELDNPETNLLTAHTTFPDELITEDDEGLGIELISEDWLVDWQFWATETIYAGTIIQLTNDERAEFHYTVEEDIEAGTMVFLSDLAGEGIRIPLLDYEGEEAEWHMEFMNAPVTAETVIHLAVVTDNTDFSVVEDHDAGWNGFWLAHDAKAITLYGNPRMIFAFNEHEVATGFELPFCENQLVDVTVSQVLAGEEPFTIEYAVNDVEYTVEDVNEGDIIFTTDTEELAPGTYEIVVTSIVDAIGLHAFNPEEIYYGTVHIHPEPVVEISFNDVVVPGENEIHILDDEPLTVTLDQVVVGTGMINLQWVINDGDPEAWEGEAGETIAAFDQLPAGEYHWSLIHLEDDNCAVQNPAEIYHITIHVAKSITDVATLAELRGMPDDGSVYRYTGEAVIVAMDGFRNRKFLQDETAAIIIDDQPGVITTEYDRYDVITNVVGKINIFHGHVQFQPEENTDPAIDNTPVDPVVFLPGDVTMDDQAKLIKLENMTFVDVDPGDVFVNGTDYVVTDGVDEFIVRTDFWHVDYIGEEIPHIPTHIAGVIIYRQNELNLIPRDAGDMETIVYDITFIVEDEDGNAIPDAVVTLDGHENAAGNYVFEDMVPGDYDYTVTADGYWPEEGTVSVVDDHVTEIVTLVLDAYTVTFSVVDEEGGAIGNAVITLGDMTNDAGDYVFEDVVPGDYNYEVTADGYWPEDGTLSVADDDVEVEVEMEVDDTSIADTELSTLKLFPNPASSTLNIVSDGAMIEEIRAVDMLGQVVYSASVQDYRHEINVSGFRNGVYFIQVATSEGLQTHRVQVTR